MNREINNIVDRIISEEFNNRINIIKNKIFEDVKMKKQICSECGSKNMYENECMECGSMYENTDKGHECSECGGQMMEGECSECGYMEGNIQELGGMDDGHPRFGKIRFKSPMSIEDIEKLLRGDDDDDSFEDDDLENIEKVRKHVKRKKDLEENEDCYECGYNESEFKESKKLSKGQQYIAKQAKPYDKIGANDFSKLRSKKSEVKEKLYGRQRVLDKNKNNKVDAEDFKMLRNESVYSLVIDGKKHLFNENEMIDIIENIVLEEKKKKKNTKKSISPIKLTKSNQDKSKKENDDYIDSVVKKMKDYLKGGSKGGYEMNPKHFPKGNGELAKMSKMAYVPSDAVGEYIDSFTAAGLENLDYDEIHPVDKWVDDLTVGSSRTGNNPEWANSVETPVNQRRNKIRKDNLLAKIKRKAYNKSPQPVLTDKSGSESDKASKIMMKLESKEERKVISDIEKMKNLISYGKKTQ